MKKFYYQIKGIGTYEDGETYWQWPPLWSDIIEAENKKEAIRQIEEGYNKKLPQRILKKNIIKESLMINIHEITEGDYTHSKLLKIHKCKYCDQEFTMLEKYQMDDGYYNFEFCSKTCRDKSDSENYIPEIGSHNPVIYKITNNVTKKCYIGQTTQPFTLRWYQHFYHGSGTKFHKAIKDSKISYWSFSVLENVIDKSKLNDREQFYIEKYNSIEKGYNSVKASSK